ncbi:CPBP family intramembrane metalloprotease [Odoribacter sp. OttesenSCG-928-L07]|nr:CPBP family intramembrane metalloprotease [Odoribacter sp. OttesenSCG-928-L07]MDL2239510.1 CPBP family intramembrane metalloprotease [Bacteroidales bacterium OttesenSCG-928-L14]
MRRKNTTLTIAFIITIILLLWLRTYFRDAEFQISGAFYILLLALLTICATWFLYRKDWTKVLGLTTKGITWRIILKSIGTGLLINLICSPILSVIYFLIFKEQPLDAFGESYDSVKLIFTALLIAPITEEIIFRGFIQGSWQKLYDYKEKMPVKLIIVITSLLFTISHFGFLHNISVKQFLFSAITIFISALYFGRLRYKYQSIIPSIFAHFGFNSAMVIVPLITMLITLAAPSNKMGEIKRQQEVEQYSKDTIPYNFDPNDPDEWQRSYEKFSRLERPRSKEMIKHLKGTATNVIVYFTIDTCGNIYNAHVAKGRDSMFIENYGYNFAADAIRFIESMPQSKPYIIDDKKVEKEMSESVPLYPF